MRLIPKKTKVRIELFKGITVLDMVVGTVLAFACIALLLSNLPGKAAMALFLLCLGVVLLSRAGGEPIYTIALRGTVHLFSKKRYNKGISDRLMLSLHQESKPEREEALQELFAAEARGMEVPDNLQLRLEEEQRQRQLRREAEEALLESDSIEGEEREQLLKKHKAEDMKTFFRPVEHADERPGEAMKEIIPFTDIRDSLICYKTDYYAAVLEIPPVEFRFFSQTRRDNSVENGLGQVLRNLSPELGANLVKLEHPVQYRSHLETEYDKLDALRAEFEKGSIGEDELRARVEIVYDRVNELRDLESKNKVIEPAYYLVLFGSDRRQLEMQTAQAVSYLQLGEMEPVRLNNRELAIFLKYSNALDFDENEIDSLDREEYIQWCQPQSVTFRNESTLVNRVLAYNMMVTGFPVLVDNSWLASVMSIPATKVVIKMRPMDRYSAVHSIDRSLSELRSQFAHTNVDSKRLELEQHVETLQQLLNMLQGDNELLLNTNVYLTAYDIAATREKEGLEMKESWLCSIANMKKQVRRIYAEQGIRLNNMQFRQFQAFEGGQVSAFDPLWKSGHGIPSNSLAAAYPWIFAHIRDDNGIKLGSSEGVPVFVDFFQRDYQRVNSNIVILGKTGSGKSYAAKSLLANLAAEDSKIFVLDPENEYAQLAENLHGKFINVGNASQNRINPFHIITDLEDDDAGEGEQAGSYLVHLQFLEEFFKQIMPDCDPDSLDYLNIMVDKLYASFGIGRETNLSALRPEDYPTFDDLHEFILHEYQTTQNEYVSHRLRVLVQQVEKFADGGRNSNLWNGPSTITTEENFTVFNFQSLLANRNSTVTNAQMLLVLKYIDNEIIKNRDFNLKYGADRRIVVVVDEAHVFIDEKYPIALDFMYQLAKRIRKYNGMQVVITQNIKDFTGSEEISRKSSAIINACQYSLIFSLAPNDITDLCTLYEKAGTINEQEQEQIVSAPRGQVFAIVSPQSRTSFRVEVPEQIRQMFQQSGCGSYYFSGEKGRENWENYLRGSRKQELIAEGGEKPQREVPALRQPGETRIHWVSAEEFARQEAMLLAMSRGSSLSLAGNAGGEEDSSSGSVGGGISVEAEEPTAPVQEAPAEAPAVSAPPEQGIGQVMESLNRFAATMERMNYNNMMAMMQQMMDARMGQQPAAEASVVPTAPAVPVAPAVPIAPVTPEVPAAEPENALGSIFNEDALREAARLDAEEKQASGDDESFDEALLSLFAEESNEPAASTTSFLDMMKTYGEVKLGITLKDIKNYLDFSRRSAEEAEPENGGGEALSEELTDDELDELGEDEELDKLLASLDEDDDTPDEPEERVEDDLSKLFALSAE